MAQVVNRTYSETPNQRDERNIGEREDRVNEWLLRLERWPHNEEEWKARGLTTFILPLRNYMRRRKVDPYRVSQL